MTLCEIIERIKAYKTIGIGKEEYQSGIYNAFMQRKGYLIPSVDCFVCDGFKKCKDRKSE